MCYNISTLKKERNFQIMKINVMKENNRIIATGSAFGKKLKAIAVCNEPVFDEAVGTEIVRRKYKIVEKMAQRKMHVRTKRELESIIKWCEKEIAHENEIIASMDKAITSKQDALESFMKEKFC